MILAVTIGSASCDRAVDAAATAARGRGEPLHIVYVADTSFLSEMPRDIHGPAGLQEHLVHIGRLIVARHEPAARHHGVAVHTEVLTGRPAGAIADHARSNGITDVYIGTDALHALEKGSRRHVEDAVAEAGATVHVVP